MSILAPHVIGGSSDALRWVRAGAHAVKLVSAFAQADEYRSAGAQLIVGRVPLTRDDAWREWVAQPDAYYAHLLAPHIEHPANRGVDVWETGVNEDYRKSRGETPDYQDIALRARFESRVAELIAAAGRRPAVGHWAVGTPSGERAEQRAAWRAYLPAIETVARCGGYIGLHAYYAISGWEFPLSTLHETIADLARGRQLILITECGREPGYRSDGYPPERYAAELLAWGERVARDFPLVAHAFIFTFGATPQWSDYDIQGDEMLVERLLAATPPRAAPSPSPSPAPAPPRESPLFRWPLNGYAVTLYAEPSGTAVRRSVHHRGIVDVYEQRSIPGESGHWWRVTRIGQAPLWMRVGT